MEEEANHLSLLEKTAAVHRYSDFLKSFATANLYAW